MAFNPNPKVTAARDFARKFNKQMVIIISVIGDEIEYASYGATKGLCDEAKGLADFAFNALLKKGWS